MWTAHLGGIIRMTGIVVALVLGLSGCVLGGEPVERKTNTQENLANQKRAAELFLNRPRPGVEEIRFTQEGNRPGLGVSWSVNAVITIEGREYREILGVTGKGAPAGEPLPETPTTASPTPVTVIYSDGSSEVVG